MDLEISHDTAKHEGLKDRTLQKEPKKRQKNVIIEIYIYIC